jgi:hypothetical protein
MNTPASPRELLMRSLRDHDMAAKDCMKIATQHLRRGYEIARELEQFEDGLNGASHSEPEQHASSAG